MATLGISRLLSIPQDINEESKLFLQDIKENYPYFSLVHWMIANYEKNHIKSRDQYHIYPINRVIYANWHDFIDDQLNPEPKITTLQHYFIEPNKNIIEVLNRSSHPAIQPLENEKMISLNKKFQIPESTEAILIPTAIYADDYLAHQGIKVSNDLPNSEDYKEEIPNDTTLTDVIASVDPLQEEDKSLMVVMSFSEWLHYLQQRSQKEKEELESKSSLKALWQKQKLTEAIEEESDEIPANIFEMAVNSIQRQESMISEPLAEIYALQGKHEKAIEMYKKLSLHNPEKNIYFAEKIKNLENNINP